MVSGINCKPVGKGLSTLKYLSRYLYKSVISDKDIIANQQGQVTFTYINSETGNTEQRTQSGEDFLWLVLQHVLPRRFRRSRDYGFLHSNGTKRLMLVQRILNVIVHDLEKVIRPRFKCKKCGEPMKYIAFSFMKPT